MFNIFLTIVFENLMKGDSYKIFLQKWLKKIINCNIIYIFMSIFK